MFYLLTKAIKVFPPWHVGISAFLVNFSDLFICKQFAYLLMVSAWLNMPNTRSHISTPCETITFWNAIKCPVFPGKTRCGFQASQLCVWYLSINIKKKKTRQTKWNCHSFERPWQPFDSLTCRTKNLFLCLKSGLFAKVWKNVKKAFSFHFSVRKIRNPNSWGQAKNHTAYLIKLKPLNRCQRNNFN